MRFRLFTLLTVLILSACENDEGPKFASAIRVLNAAPDGPIIDGVLDFLLVAQRLRYTEVSPYVTVESNQYQFQVRNSIASILIDLDPLFTTNVNLQPDQQYTVLAIDRRLDTARVGIPVCDRDRDDRFDEREERFNDRFCRTIETLVLVDNRILPGPDSAVLRVVDAAPTERQIDVYITAPTVDINTVAPTFNNLSYRITTAYLSLAAGSYRVRVTLAGTKTVIFDTAKTAIVLTPGQVLTGVLLESPGRGAISILRILSDTRPFF